MPIAAPTLADLTSATLEGTGVFDTLMKAARAHLDEQFSKNRIKGPEYATVYLGSLEQVLANSVQFLLAKDKIGLDSQLLEKQLEIAGVELQIKQVELAIAEKNSLKVTAEIAVLVAQECKLRAEYDVLMETKLKTVQETMLLTWKVTTEKAQTLALGVDDNSVIGKQKLLYAAQTEGFLRDGEQKVAKIMVDSWNVRRTTDEGTVADATNMLNDTSVGRAVTKLLAGVGA
jgi:hypothetical protein